MKRAAVLWVLALMLASWGTCRAADDELAVGRQRASALAFINTVNLSGSQLRRMVPFLQRIQAAMKDRDSNRVDIVSEADAADAMEEARELLMADQEVPQETLDKLQETDRALRKADQDTYVAIAGEMQGMSRVFTPAQNALLDWTAPASVRSGPTPQELAALQREIDARVNGALEMLNRIKFLSDFNFRTGRITIIQTYLARNQTPAQPLPENALDICLAATTQARVVPLAQWQQAAPGIAAQMLSQLGLMPTLSQPANPNAISWGTLYRIFTSPETLKVVQEAQQYRRG